MPEAIWYWGAVGCLGVAFVMGERHPGWTVGRVPHPGYTWSAVLCMLIYLGVK